MISRDDLRKKVEAEERRRRDERQRIVRNVNNFKTADLTPPVLTIADCLGAGLPRDDARALASASERFRGGADLRRPEGGSTKQERAAIREICLAVANVVGMGVVDKRLLNHRIRDVLRALLNSRPVPAADEMKYARRLCWTYAQPSFLADATAAYERLGQPCLMTKNWLRDGGWRAHWYALSVLTGLAVQIPLADGSLGPPDTALLLALGYMTLAQLNKGMFD